MPVHYALRGPTGDEGWNLLSLREAARLKGGFIGVYYSPQLRRLLAVFRVPPDSRVDEAFFERVEPSLLEGSYRMECPGGCGRCCAAFSGAFMLDYEVGRLPEGARQRVELQPSRLVETPRGPVRVYRLDTGPAGRCIFFDAGRCACGLEEDYGRGHKPIVCLLTYCTIFASRGQTLYLKVSARRVGGTYEMVYRAASEGEWRRALRSMSRCGAGGASGRESRGAGGSGGGTRGITGRPKPPSSSPPQRAGGAF